MNPPARVTDLLPHAITARDRAHAPYSGFQIGAAVLADGLIFTGANIENSAFSLTNCAERTAVFKAISEGARTITAVVVVADSVEPLAPCGACRQVLAEFCPPDAPVLMANLQGETRISTIAKLLPGAYPQIHTTPDPS